MRLLLFIFSCRLTNDRLEKEKGELIYLMESSQNQRKLKGDDLAAGNIYLYILTKETFQRTISRISSIKKAANILTNHSSQQITSDNQENFSAWDKI